VFKGVSTVRGELNVSVAVGPALLPLSNELPPFTPWMSREPESAADEHARAQQQQ
jgi:hypothetical protein